MLYFDKIQAALLDENPDEEVSRLREAALESVRSDPGLHQLVPYFVNFVANQVTHRLDDVFVLRQMMELTAALVSNDHLFLAPYAAPLCAPVLTCLVGRKLGSDDGSDGGVDAVREAYLVRELAASLLGRLAAAYARSNTQLRPKLTRTCLKTLLDPTRPAPVLYGAVCGLAAAGGAEAVRILVVPNLKHLDAGVLQPLQERVAAGTASALDFEMLVDGGIVRALRTLVEHAPLGLVNGINGAGTSEAEATELSEYLGPIVGSRVAALGDHRLNRIVLGTRDIE